MSTHAAIVNSRVEHVDFTKLSRCKNKSRSELYISPAELYVSTATLLGKKECKHSSVLLKQLLEGTPIATHAYPYNISVWSTHAFTTGYRASENWLECPPQKRTPPTPLCASTRGYKKLPLATSLLAKKLAIYKYTHNQRRAMSLLLQSLLLAVLVAAIIDVAFTQTPGQRENSEHTELAHIIVTILRCLRFKFTKYSGLGQTTDLAGVN